MYTVSTVLILNEAFMRSITDKCWLILSKTKAA